MELQYLESKLAEWHLRKYGRIHALPHRTLAKLVEEFGEFCRALNQIEDVPTTQQVEAVGLEAADILFVLIHLVRNVGASLTGAVTTKIAIIFDRLTDPNAGREPCVIIPEPAWYDGETPDAPDSRPAPDRGPVAGG